MACFPGQPADPDPLSDPDQCELDQEDSGLLRPHSTQSTIEWLESNYHYQEGICLPRSSIYDHYLDFCTREQLQPVNAASFGKIIRQQFPSLTTRRLGTRGQSKYHYYGLGIRPISRYYTEQYLQKQQTQGAARKEESKKPHTYYASKEKQSAVLPAFPDIKVLTLPESISRDKLQTFMVMYRAHCQRILDSVVRANFSDVENFLLHFWQGMPPHLLSVLPNEVVVDLVALCDIMLYKVVTNVLISSPLQNFPESLTQEVLKFSAMLSPWLENAMKGLPDTLREAKQKVADSFARNVRRQTSLMHIAQAARNALRAEDSILQLKKDWMSLDLHTVFAHTLYAVQPLGVSQQYIEMVPEFVEEFAGLIQDKSSVEDFVVWIESVMERCIREPEECTNSMAVHVMKTGRIFLLTWKFFTSKIVREFTLQSAPSFGTFHLLHILIDDYIIHVLESSMENLQERMYKSKIDMLIKQEDKFQDIQVEDHFSGPEDPHTTTTPTSDEDGPDLSVIAQAVRYTLQPESHLPQQANSTTGSAGAMFEGLPAISQAATAPLMTTVAAPLPSSRISGNLPGGSMSNQPIMEATREGRSMSGINTALSGSRTADLPLTVSRATPLEATAVVSHPQAQLGSTFGTFAFSTASTSTLSHVHQVQSLGNQNLTLHPMPLHATNQTIPLSAAAQNIQTTLNPAQVATSTANMPNFPAIQMPLTHPITARLPAPGNPTGIPLLPTMPNVYPYPYPASIPGIQNLPSQPISSTMVRMNAPGFPSQTLVSGYPSYVQPSVYGNTQQVSASNFSR